MKNSELTCIIVEDEPMARVEMRRLLLNARPDAKIVAEVDSIEAACEALERLKPKLAFFDIQLADGPSFEIFRRINVEAQVIFTTAYDAYALQAFRVNSIDYLLKPIEPKLLEEALARYDKVSASETQENAPLALTAEQLKSLLQPQKQAYKTRFVVSGGDRIRYIAESEVRYFMSEHEATFLVSTDGRRHLFPQTLEQLEQVLDPALFFRISRQIITSLPAIAEIHRHFNGRLKLNLNPAPSEEVFVSRQRVPDFMKWIDS
jgi:DNA-binding LytR/AlgR family response regulator